jgi:hypothetical protein
MNKKDLIAGVVYNSTIEHEIEWRNDKVNEHDVSMMDELLKEINELGYEYKYEADLICRDLNDKRIINILKKFIGKFKDEGISAELVGVIGIKGFNDVTEIVINNYIDSSIQTKFRQGVFYDNALYNISDKRYISEYINFLKNEQNATNLPLTMLMIAKWRVEDAKHLFVKYLSKTDSVLGFTAIEALSYYNDPTLINCLEPLLKSSNKDIVRAVKKSIKKLNKLL